VLEEVFLRYDGEAIRDEVLRLQEVFLAHCDPDLVRPLRFAEANRSGIVALEVDGDVAAIMVRLAAAGVVMTGPAGYLRLAPHFHQQDRQMIGAAAIVNRICAEQS
jgi:hypothetical protein